MTKTLFSKMMIAFIGIIIFTTLLSSIFISVMLEREAVRDATDEMIVSTREVNDLYSLYRGGSISSTQYMQLLCSKADNEGDIIWFVHDDSIWVTSNPQYNGNLSPESILEYYGDMMGEIQSGYTSTNYSYSTVEPFSVPVLTVGAPVFDGSGKVAGAVFVHKELSSVTDSVTTVRAMIIFAGVISGLASVVLCYFFSKALLRPLTHVSNAAKELAKGNFDVRVENTAGDEIGQLAQTFNQASEDLAKYENTRRSFIANVSHDLRSPLTSMQGLVQGVLDGTIPEDKRDYYLTAVLDETKRLNVLINDLLDLTRMESGTFPMNIQAFDICELIRRIIITFESKITAGGINVEINMPEGRTSVTGDPDRISQVLVNLIDNAVKFTPVSGVIAIDVVPGQKACSVSVKNTGEPINEEDLPYLFDRFYKADKSRNRESQGTGLGLSIVKKILAQHGEKITVKSDAVSGTVFSFQLRNANKDKKQS